MLPPGRAVLRCTACEHENPDGNRFCGGCGAQLPSGCASCGHVNPEGNRFCGACGAPLEPGVAVTASPRTPRDYTPRHLSDRILASKAALEGERKQVTVLFADVRRSTELASSVDPEDWHGILDGFFTHLTDGVHRFEGTVNQYTGDGIMALFGAPIAHEDHAQRACWAALHLRDTLRRYAREVKREHAVDFAVRIGLNSGDVVVGKIGDDLRMDYTAQGTTVHLAARMESLAEAGQVYLAPDIARLVAPYFELEDLGEFTVSGLDVPVRVHELRGEGDARTRFDVSRARGLSRFVGRDSEVGTLEAALAQARAGNGQVVGVVAEAGTGKSRLCFEFIERCRAQGMRVLQGSGVAHGKNLPLLPILQVIRGYFEIGERDEPRQAREKVAGRMLLLDEAYRDELPLLFELLGVPDPERPAPPLPPEARQKRLFGVLRNLLHSRAQPGQDVGMVMIEDLHWIDEGSDAWLTEWAEGTAGAPYLLLVNFRPEYRAAWMQRAHYQQIALAPLSAEAIRDLLCQLLGADPSTEGLAARIHAHTAGNPFFAEEVVQSLIESGQLEGAPGAYRLVGSIERIEVPQSVHALLAARIDRLAEREKRVLQMASVIGKDFAEPLLAEVSQLADRDLADALATLRSAEYVHPLALYPVALYTFKHPLTQEVAQNSLLRDRRRAIHAAVAKAIEARSADLDEDAALLAHHHESAGDGVTASRWHLRAADWIGPNDVYASSRHARAVFALLGEHEEHEGAAALLAAACARLVGLGWRLGMEDEAARLYTEGRRWAQAAGDLDAEARIAGAYAAVLAVAGRLEESAEVGDVFNELAKQLGDPELQAVAHAWMTFPPMRMGRLEEAERRIQDGIRACERQPDLGTHFLGVSLKGFMFQWRSEIYSLTRPWPEVEEALERAVHWARGRNEAENECYSLGMIRYLSGSTGKSESYLRQARQVLGLAEKLGAPLARTYAKLSLAACLLDLEQPGEALDLLDEALSEARQTRAGLDDEPEHLRFRARALLALGRGADALASAEAALAACEERRTGMYLPDVLRDLAWVRLAGGDLDGAASALDRAEREAREIGALNVLPMITWTRADLAGHRGDATAQRALLEAALTGLRARGASGHAETVSRILAALAG